MVKYVCYGIVQYNTIPECAVPYYNIYMVCVILCDDNCAVARTNAVRYHTRVHMRKNSLKYFAPLKMSFVWYYLIVIIL